ncbi:uncharacterized protein [Diabrotica undecimpunctata]|uniref:uncharacterized protein n=1 Tax=Diabrotica undecimpunctata TaxID=50387 RepID=UPI003B6426E7
MFYRIIIWLLFISFCHASWVNDIISPKGWKFGDGMVFHIEDTKDKNLSLFDRIALKVDYGKVQVSAVQKPEKEAVQLNFFFRDEEEGRSKKNMGTMMIPFLIGVAKGTAVTMVLSALKLFAIKALLLAKTALILSVIIIASKYIKKSEPQYMEVEQHAASENVPVFEYPAPSASDQIPAVAISPYHAYEPYAAAESALNYATVVEAPVDNKTAPVKQFYVQAATKRRDLERRKVIPAPAVLTIRQYSRPESGLL